MFATALSFARARFTYANVASTLALVVALGTGTAYAANTVKSSDIVNGQVKTADLANEAVGPAKIKPDAVAGGSVLDGSLSSADLGSDSVGASEIADGSIDSGEIINGSLSGADISDGSLTGADVSANSISAADILGTDRSGNVGFGGLTAGRCTQVNLSVSGAQVGETAVVSTTGSFANGLMLTANRVTSSNVVQVNYCNLSGADVGPVSTSVRVMTFG